VQELSGSTPTANLLIGLGADEIFSRTTTTENRSFLADALGSTIALADGAGAVQTSYTYDPFGNATSSGAASSNSRQYTGREADGTSLLYLRARYYSPTLQRFLSEDPLGFASGDTNLYAYVGDSPLNRVDPSGLCGSIPILDLINAVRGRCGWGERAFIFASYTPWGRLIRIGRELRAIRAAEEGAEEFVDLTTAARRRHILEGDATGGGHAPGTGIPGKTEFPPGWSDDKIIHEISDVATDPDAVTVVQGGVTKRTGTRDGVIIRVIINNKTGEIITGYPINRPKNP
jgi:RHS repeat-associated protein